MYPEKYYKDLESSKKRGKYLTEISITVTFLAFFFIGGQLVHEIGHILVLMFYSCFYNIDPGFTVLNGFTAAIQPVCTLNDAQLLLFYSSGYIATLAAGLGLNTLGLRSRSDLKGYMLTAAGIGALMSILLTLGGHGDIESFLSVLGLNSFYSGVVKIFFILGILGASLEDIKMLLERQD